MLISLMAFDLMAGRDHRRSRSAYIGSVIGCRIACDVQYDARFSLICRAPCDASFAITAVQIFISLFKKRFPARKPKRVLPAPIRRRSRPRRFISKRFSALRKQRSPLFTRHYSICVLFQFRRRGRCKRECFQVNANFN